MYVDFHILNELGTPALFSNTLANRGAAGQTGRLFISTDTYEIYRDNGSSWDLIGSGSSGITGSGTATQVAYWNSGSSISGNSNLYFNPTFAWLGIGTSVPLTKLHAKGVDTILEILETTGTTGSLLAYSRNATLQYSEGYNYNNNSYPHYQIYDEVGGKNVFGILQSSRFVGINYQFTGAIDVPRYYLDVNGDIGATGVFDFGNNAITRLTSTGNKISSKYLGVENGLRFDYLGGTYFLGDFLSTTTYSPNILIDTSNGSIFLAPDANNVTQFVADPTSFKTRYQDNDNGLTIDFVNNLFNLSDNNHNGTGLYNYSNVDTGITEISLGYGNIINDGIGYKYYYNTSSLENYLSIGDWSYLINNTQLIVDIKNQIIRTMYSGSDKGLFLNFNNAHYQLGDTTNVYFDADNDNGFASIWSGGYLCFHADMSLTQIGDINTTGNGTNFGVFDSIQSLIGSANLLSATAGGSSGQHIKIQINGVNYKIALLNA